MPTHTTPARRSRAGARPQERTPLSRRLAVGLIAGVTGAAAVDLAGRAAEHAGRSRRPTLLAQLVAKTVRLPDASRRQQSATHQCLAAITGMQDTTGTDPQRIEYVGQFAHYAWSAAWGAARGAVATRRFSRFSASLIHGVAFAATDHVLLASTNLGAPIWGDHPDPADAALQAGELLLYILVTSLTYQQLAASPSGAPAVRVWTAEHAQARLPIARKPM